MHLMRAAFFAVVAAAVLAGVSPEEEVSRRPADGGCLKGLCGEGLSRRMRKLLKERWPRGAVRFAYGDDFPRESRRGLRRAMEALANATCVRFREAAPEERRRLQVSGGRGCSSAIGYARDRPRPVNLHRRCFAGGLGTAVHELVHALGFHHQQARPDRDYHVAVHAGRIQPGKEGNFARLSGEEAFLDTFGLPYDYNSVMHYSAHSFAVKGAGPVIEVVGPFGGLLGQRHGPSRGDVAAINRKYECWDYYLGDDIPGALPYKDFHDAYMSKTPLVSGAAREWEEEARRTIAEGVRMAKEREKKKGD